MIKIKQKSKTFGVMRIVSVAVIFFSVVGIAMATTPNPGHPWTEVGDGTFQVTGPTTLRSYAFPDVNATVLTAPAMGTSAQYYRGDGSFQTLDTLAVPENTNLYYTAARFNADLATKSTSNLAEGSNLYYTQGRFDTAFGNKSTTDLTEGTNLYYTLARFNTALAGKSTTDLAEGTNLYYTQGRFDTAFGGKSTTNLAEGTNLYYTDARARAAISGTAPLSYNSTTGVLSIPAATTLADGYLSSTDWNIFNNKVSASRLIGTSAPLSGGGDLSADRTISISQSTGSTDGYLSSIDWNTFNNKEPAVTAGSSTQYYRGDKTFQELNTDAVAEGLTNLYYTDVRADARITAQKAQPNGLATLDGSSKIPTSQLPALAITNTFVVASQIAMLALTAQTGDVAVRTDENKSYILAGSSASTLADWQELLTPTDTVLSVNGQTGSVTLTTSDINEGTNLYYTDARARAAISGTAPLSYNSTTGVLSIPAATTLADGYLSSTDWNTFNGKEAAITAGTTAQYYRGDKTFQTLDTSAVPENGNVYYTDARARAALSGTAGRVSYNSTTGAINIDSAYVGQTSISTLGTITSGTWTGASIGTAYTDAKIKTVAGTLNRLSVGGTSTDPTFDIDANYAGQSTITTLGTIGTGTWNGSIIDLAHGGTNANLTASNGGIFYSTGSTAAILAGTATAGQILRSGLSAAPSWSTAVYPATTTANQLLYSSADNTIAGLATGNNGVLITGSSGIPSISSTIPSATQDNITRLGTISSGVWNGTAIGDTYLATSYIKADGTRTLSADWDAGAHAITAKTFSVSGTAGAGFINLLAQSSNASAPSSTGLNLFAGSAGNLSWATKNGIDTFNRSFTGTLTADRNWALPDVGGTIATIDGGQTFSAATWNGTVIGSTYGGTGVNNGSSTITLGGNLTTSGAFATTLTATGTTSITLPTTGTLATTSNTLGDFASTTSAQLATVLSDETGSGLAVFGTSPAISTPTLTLANTAPTATGSIGYDQTNTELDVGNGSTASKIRMGAWNTWIPAYTGFSADPSSVTARYTLIGKTCIAYINATSGTSNATTFTITLPVAAANTAGQSIPVFIVNNGTAASSRMVTRVNSTTADVYKDATLAAFLNSGNKNMTGVFMYETI